MNPFKKLKTYFDCGYLELSILFGTSIYFTIRILIN